MKRPKKNTLSPQKKQARTEVGKKQKAQAIASAALAKLPAGADGKDRRNQLFAEAERLKKEQQSISALIGQHKKRMQEVYGLTPESLAIRKILLGAPDGRYEATLQQVELLLRDAGRPFQLELFGGEPGKGVPPDEAIGQTVFDTSKSGERAGAEQGGDPGRARRGPKGNGPAPAAPSPGIPLDEAQKAFEAAKEAKPPKPANDGADANDGSYTQQLRERNAETEREIKNRAAGVAGHQTPDIPAGLKRDKDNNLPPKAPEEVTHDPADDYRIVH
jgi:hypothetical protein